MAQFSNSRPVVGVALKLDHLERVERLRDFVLERNRDVEIQDFNDIDALRTDWSPLVERGCRLLDGHAGRVGIHGPFWGLALDTPDPDIRAIVTARLKAGLEACIALAPDPSAAHMVVHSPITTWDWYNRHNWPGSLERQIALVHESLGPIVPRAEDAGVAVVIETIEDKSPEDLAALVRSFDSPAVRASLDTGHAHYAHGATGAPPVDYFVRALDNLLAHVHLQDADGFADRHWGIGQGSVMWPAVFRALDDLEEMPRLMLELANPEHVLPSARWLEAHGLAV